MPGNLKPGDVQATPPTTGVVPQQRGDMGTSHIVNFSTKEMQEALKDMEITRQVCVMCVRCCPLCGYITGGNGNDVMSEINNCEKSVTEINPLCNATIYIKTNAMLIITCYSCVVYMHYLLCVVGWFSAEQHV